MSIFEALMYFGMSLIIGMIAGLLINYKSGR